MEREGCRWCCGRVTVVPLAVVMALAMLLGWSGTASANQLTEITIPDRNGEIPDQWTSYEGPPRAKVLLPDGYSPRKSYPLLILLAGANSSYKTWSDENLGRIQTTAAGFPGIIVMPEGSTGYYTDWWSGGKRGTPAWESYYMDQVIPQIMARYPIRPERRWHALSGVSMGGLGTAYLSGRLPGFFGSIAIFSGVVDTHLFPGFIGAAAMIGQASAGVPADPDALYGPEEGFYAHGHDPMRLAENQQHTRVFMATGNGVPTDDGEPLVNSPVTDVPGEVILARPSSDNYAKALEAAGVDLTYSVRDGIHDFANFRTQLRDAIAWDMFAPVEEHPESWVNDTVATRGKLWEFDYEFASPPERIVRFKRTPGRLHISGAGSAVKVTTTGGCDFQIDTPGTIDVPDSCGQPEPKVRLKVKLKPGKIRTGRKAKVRVVVRPAMRGVKVRLGGKRATTNKSGIARFRLCRRAPQKLIVKATAPGYLPGKARLRVVGRSKPCRR